MINIVKTIEVAIGVASAVVISRIVIKILVGTDFFSYIRQIVYDTGYLLGGNFASYLFTVMLGLLVVMFGRWIISRTSSNGGQTPNNNGN